MYWQTKSGGFDLARGPLVMGIVNVTVDSFSDGGKCLDPQAAVTQALRLEREGADVIDLGGESSRPGAEPVPAAEEMERVLPVVKALASRLRCPISIDTCKPEVAEAALALGASIVNDIHGLRDPAMAELVRGTGAGAVVMHMQGEPRTMQQAPVYEDVVGEIREFFRQSFLRLVASGMSPAQIVFDPGLGFGKTLEHNLALLKNPEALRIENRPLLLGFSRKGFLAQVTGAKSMPERLAPTLALTAVSRAGGGDIFRVHDVLENVRALRMVDAVRRSP